MSFLENVIVIGTVFLFFVAGAYSIWVFFVGLTKKRISILTVTLIGTMERCIDREKSPIHYTWVIVFMLLCGVFLLWLSGFIVYSTYINPLEPPAYAEQYPKVLDDALKEMQDPPPEE